ncbi:MAG: hypothetical protein WC997_08105 [Porticoccaceae bacterium]
MSEYPTAEQFSALFNSYNRYEEVFIEKWRASTQGLYDDQLSLKKLSAIAEESSRVAFKTINEYNAQIWLSSQPSFTLAVGALGLPTSSTPQAAERAVASAARLLGSYKNHDYRFTCQVAGMMGIYQKYLAGVAECFANYLTGRSVRAATQGERVLEKMRTLTSELQQLISGADFFSERARESLRINIERAATDLDRLNYPSASKRQDARLRERLMASEIIRFHHDILGGPMNRAVFQLMGLPFVKGQIEMRTIERLANAEGARIEARTKAKREATIEAMAKERKRISSAS